MLMIMKDLMPILAVIALFLIVQAMSEWYSEIFYCKRENKCQKQCDICKKIQQLKK